MNYTITIDNATCKSKDECRFRTPIFQNQKRYKQQTMPILDIVEQIEEKKYMFMPAVLTYNEDTEKFDFLSQMIYAIDIDNTDNNIKSLKDILSCLYSHKLYPFLIYETYSSTADHFKCRILFKTRVKITSKVSRDQILNTLIYVISKAYPNSVDKSCTNITRIFYPGKRTVFKDTNAILNRRTVLDIIQQVVNSSSHKNKRLNMIRKTLPAVFKSYIDLNLKNKKKLKDVKVLEVFPDVYTIKPNNNNKPEYKDVMNMMRDTTENNTTGDFLFYDKENFIDILYRLPLDKILHTQKYEYCILHEDTHKSTQLIKLEDNHYVYYCYACRTGINLLHFIQTELQHYIDIPLNLYNAAIWTADLLNVLFIDRKTYNLINNAVEYENRLNNLLTEDFKKQYPRLSSRFQRYNNHRIVLRFMIKSAILFSLVHPILNTKTPTLFVYYCAEEITERLTKAFKGYRQFSINSVKYSLRFLTRIGLLESISESEIPKYIYARLDKHRVKKHRKRHISVYKLSYYSEDIFKYAENILRDDFKKCASSQGYSRDQYLCQKDISQADIKYPQDTERLEITEKTKDFYDQIIEMLSSRFEEKSYISIKEIKKNMQQIYEYSETYCNRYFSKTMPGVMTELDLVRTTCTIGLKAVFHMNEDYANSTTIILPKRVYDAYPTMLQEYEEKIKQDVKNVAKQYLETQLNNSHEYVMWTDLRPYLEDSFPDMKEKRITSIFYSGYNELVEEFKQQHHIHIVRTSCTKEIMKRFQLTNPINSTYYIYIFEPIQESITQVC